MSRIRIITLDEYSVAKINQYEWKELLKVMTSVIFDGKRLKTREYTVKYFHSLNIIGTSNKYCQLKSMEFYLRYTLL